MEEFQEIAHTGGKIEFVYSEEEQGVSIRISHVNPWATTMVQLCISYDGKVLDFVPSAGIGAVIPYPQPSLLAFLLSDKEGLFGQSCPKCDSYFRSDAISGTTTCPYCGQTDKGIEFLTKNQLKFLDHFCGSFITAHNEKQSIILDLDEILNNMDGNSPEWIYPEERQQTKKKCECRCVYDILGDYGVCPSCSRANFKEIITEKFDSLEAQFNEINGTVTDRSDREVEWEKLTRCVSEFEALANNLRIHLIKIPATPKRKSDINRLSFQRIMNCSSAIKSWFDIDIFKGIKTEEQEFLNKMFNRRHVFTHNGGRIDQEYINNTGDTTVRINQTIKFKSKEIKRLIPLVRKCSDNFVAGYDSIK